MMRRLLFSLVPAFAAALPLFAEELHVSASPGAGVSADTCSSSALCGGAARIGAHAGSGGCRRVPEARFESRRRHSGRGARAVERGASPGENTGD